MKIFITEVELEDGLYEGPEILAETQDEAESIASHIRYQNKTVVVSGELGGVFIRRRLSVKETERLMGLVWDRLKRRGLL